MGSKELEPPTFRYQPTCSFPGCEAVALYKAAAPWSDGKSHELKNYGLACEAHRGKLLKGAESRRRDLCLAEGETIGPLGLYLLTPGCRDAELARVTDDLSGR